MKASKIIVTLVILSVAVVFVAPFVSLEPTALRSAQAAFALLAALATMTVFRFAVPASFVHQPIQQAQGGLPYFSDVLDLLCSRLC